MTTYELFQQMSADDQQTFQEEMRVLYMSTHPNKWIVCKTNGVNTVLPPYVKTMPFEQWGAYVQEMITCDVIEVQKKYY